MSDVTYNVGAIFVVFVTLISIWFTPKGTKDGNFRVNPYPSIGLIVLMWVGFTLCIELSTEETLSRLQAYVLGALIAVSNSAMYIAHLKGKFQDEWAEIQEDEKTRHLRVASIIFFNALIFIFVCVPIVVNAC